METLKLLTIYFFLIFTLTSLPATEANLFTLPEEKIDIGEVALKLAKVIYPNIDVGTYSSKLDELAEQVNRLTKGTKDPDYRIRCLNTVLFQYEKFRGIKELSAQRKSENYFLHNVLDTKQGNCFSMPLLYIAVAQRLGWPVYVVHVPDHTFVRYVDPAFKQQNIESTSGGGYVTDEKYSKDFMVSETGRTSGAYLRTLTHHELIGDLMAINAITIGQRGELEKAIDILNLATQFNPRSVDAWANLRIAAKLMANRSKEPESEKFIELEKIYSKKLDALGFVKPIDVPQFIPTGRSQ